MHVSLPRPTRPCAAMLLIASGVSLPAVVPSAPALAPAAIPGLRLTVAPDPAAPAGRTPKAVFRLLGAVKGREYRIEAMQVSGQNPLNEQGYPVVCSNSVGRFSYTRATGKTLVFLPAPLTSYELGSGSPCTGTFKGELQTPRRGNSPKVLQTFTLQIPSMKLSRVRVPAR